MAAANLPDEEYDQVELITDPALCQGFSNIELTPDPDEWLWAGNSGMPATTNFIRGASRVFEGYNSFDASRAEA